MYYPPFFLRITTIMICMIATLFLSGGCSNSKKKLMPEYLSENDLYQIAKKALDDEKYDKAIKALNTLESRYPFGPFAQQTFFDLMYASYMDDKPEATKATADRFIRLNPNHPRVDYALYMKGLASNTASSGLITRYLPIDDNKRDPGKTLESFRDFSELIVKYPNSPYTPDAYQRIIALRNRLAAGENYTANYYLKRKSYIAAINRCWYILQYFQQTPAGPEALAIMYESYLHLDLKDLAELTLKLLKLNYPNHPSLDQSGNFIGFKIFDDVNPSLLSTLTFGLIGNKKASTKVATRTDPKKTSTAKSKTKEKK